MYFFFGVCLGRSPKGRESPNPHLNQIEGIVLQVVRAVLPTSELRKTEESRRLGLVC